MAALTAALVAICLIAASAAAAILALVAVAIHREERHLTLTRPAPGSVTRAGRRLTGLYVRPPRRTATGDRDKALV